MGVSATIGRLETLCWIQKTYALHPKETAHVQPYPYSNLHSVVIHPLNVLLVCRFGAIGRKIWSQSQWLMRYALFTKGNGIQGVDVGLKKKPGGQLVGNAKTDTGGKFYLGALEPETYSIVLRIPESAMTTFDSAIANARTCGVTATASDPLNTVIRIEGARSVSVVVGVEMPRNRSFNKGVPSLTMVYEVQFEVTGRQAVSGEVGIVIKEAGAE